MICLMNAAKNYIPLFFIFSRVINFDVLMTNAPYGNLYAGIKSGWSENTIIMKWLENVYNVTKPNIENPHQLFQFC